MTTLISRHVYTNQTIETHFIEPYEVQYDPDDPTEGSFQVNAADFEVGKHGEMIDVRHSTVFNY